MKIWMVIALATFGFTNCHKSPEKSTADSWEKTITNKYWKLISIKGRIIQRDFIREPGIILRLPGNQMKGNGVCKPFTAVYKIGSSNRISFSEFVSKDTGCDASETQKEFFHVLKMTNRYTIHQDTLLLKINNQHELARLEAVYFE